MALDGATRTIVSALLVVCLISSWVGQAEVTRWLETSQRTSPDLQKPRVWFLTWITQCGYVLPLPPVIAYLWRKHLLGHVSWREWARVGVIFSSLLFALRISWYYSLQHTDVNVNTAIYQSSCVFVFALSYALLGEKATALKLGSLLLCVAGVGTISASSSRPHPDAPQPLCAPQWNVTDAPLNMSRAGNHPPAGTSPPLAPTPDDSSWDESAHTANSAGGIAAVLASAFFYALYEVLYAVMVPLRAMPAHADQGRDPGMREPRSDPVPRSCCCLCGELGSTEPAGEAEEEEAALLRRWRPAVALVDERPLMLPSITNARHLVDTDCSMSMSAEGSAAEFGASHMDRRKGIEFVQDVAFTQCCGQECDGKQKWKGAVGCDDPSRCQGHTPAGAAPAAPTFDAAGNAGDAVVVSMSGARAGCPCLAKAPDGPAHPPFLPIPGGQPCWPECAPSERHNVPAQDPAVSDACSSISALSPRRAWQDGELVAMLTSHEHAEGTCMASGKGMYPAGASRYGVGGLHKVTEHSAAQGPPGRHQGSWEPLSIPEGEGWVDGGRGKDSPGSNSKNKGRGGAGMLTRSTGGSGHPASRDVTLHQLLVGSFLYVGVVGAATAVLWGLPLLPLHYLRLEVFQWPDEVEMKVIVANSLMEIGYCIFLVLGIVISSPLFISIGVVLAIPASMVVDVLAHGATIPASSIVGSIMIAAGFVSLNFAMVHQNEQSKGQDGI